MINITVDSKQAMKQIDGLIKDLDYSKPFKDARKYLDQEYEQNFSQQGAIYQGGGFVRAGGAFSNQGRATTRGRAWQPLAPKTVEQRIRLGFGGKRPILIRRGNLKRSYRSKSGKDFVEGENTSDIAVYHNEGTSKMPQRKILDASEKFIRTLELLLINYTNKQIKRNGLSN